MKKSLKVLLVVVLSTLFLVGITLDVLMFSIAVSLDKGFDLLSKLFRRKK